MNRTALAAALRGGAAAFATLVAVAAPQPAAASSEEEDATPPSSLPVQRDTLSVEESLPYMPASSTIATRLPLEVDRTPTNVGVVDFPLFEQQGAGVLGDALVNISGLNVQTGNGIFDFFVVRGFDSLSSGLVLTDGAPEPEVSFYQLYNVERVEVMKGPSGFLYGSNPLAGVVNLVRKQPVPSDFGVAGLTVGSFSTYEARVDFNRGSERVDFRINGLWQESDGYRDGRASEVAAVNPAFTWRPTDSSSLHLNLEAASSDYVPDAGLPLALAGGAFGFTPSRTASYALPSDASDQQIGRVQLDFETTLSSSLVLRNKTYYRTLDWRSDGTILTNVNPQDPFFGASINRNQVVLDDDQAFFGNQFEALWNATTGGVEHQLIFGLEAARLTDDFAIDTRPILPIPIDGSFEPGVGPFPLFPLSAGDTTSEILAPYVIDQISVSDRLQVLLGARYDSIDFEDGVTSVSSSDGELSPMAGVVFAPREDASIYANYARSFAPPSPRVRGIREPEESEQIEIGVRKSWRDGRVRATLAAYEIERDNGTIPDETGVILLPGDKRSRGVEADVTANLGDTSALVSYAYTDAELTSFRQQIFIPFVGSFDVDYSGNAIPFAPEHLVNVWVSHRLGNRWTLAGGARYVDDQFISENNLADIDSYSLLSASITYTLPRYLLRLNLENLLDEEYETRGFGSLTTIPGTPFAASLSVKVSL